MLSETLKASLQTFCSFVWKSDLGTHQERSSRTAKALNMSLQYSFVTPLTSMVVTKPDALDSPLIANKLTEGKLGVIVIAGDFWLFFTGMIAMWLIVMYHLLLCQTSGKKPKLQVVIIRGRVPQDLHDLCQSHKVLCPCACLFFLFCFVLFCSNNEVTVICLYAFVVQMKSHVLIIWRL